MKKSEKPEKPPEIVRDIFVEGEILDMINNALDLNRLQLSGWEKGFLLSLLDYEAISQKQLNSLYTIVWRLDRFEREKITTDGLARDKAMREEISAALRRKAAEKRQPPEPRRPAQPLVRTRPEPRPSFEPRGPSQPVVLKSNPEYLSYLDQHPNYDLPGIDTIPFDCPYIIRARR